MKRLTIILTALALTLAACAGDGAGNKQGSSETPGTPVADPVITIEDMKFVNGTVTIEAGTTVTWEWNDGSMEHNVVFEEFESPLQAEGTFTHTFEEPGTFDYHCQPHPFMTGTIFVVEPGEA
ncbi:MAG TPA: plastocyanin/azurin family copper-binding protein [Acidimicrobiia bacterium]|nr:plastocyanin/azurin family copper-binding protein [Acidimicrobiia bacterium]